MTAAQDQLRALMFQLAPQVGPHDVGLPHLRLYRWEAPNAPLVAFHEASLCLVGQGRKRVMVGSRQYDYDADHYLISSIALPINSQVLEASPKHPYVGLTWNIDVGVLNELLLERPLAPVPEGTTGPSMAVEALDSRLVDAFHRLLALAQRPESVPVLAPLLQREILYYLLDSPQGPLLAQMARSGTPSSQISQAVSWLKKHFSQPVRMEDVAQLVHMSPSSFYAHFKELTAMTPLQFQKWLRLQEARKLLVNERMDVASAAFRVGYESPSQFNREYKRLFSTTPLRDVRSLRNWEIAG